MYVFVCVCVRRDALSALVLAHWAPTGCPANARIDTENPDQSRSLKQACLLLSLLKGQWRSDSF